MNEKIVYIAHPITEIRRQKSRLIFSKRATQRNLKQIEVICKKLHSVDLIPIAPYLAYLSYLDNTFFRDLSFGIRVNQLFFEKKFMDEVWLYGDRISPGMKQEIELAHQYKIPVMAKTKETEVEYKNLLKTL